jgi:hypothetical protein
MAWVPTVADAAEDFYSGKPIRLLIATPARGSCDAYARGLAMRMPNHIPGHPENMPGAARAHIFLNRRGRPRAGCRY